MARSGTLCRPVPIEPGAVVTVRAVVEPSGAGSADARVLIVKGRQGTLVSTRVSSDGIAGFQGPTSDRVPGSLVGDGERLTVTVRIRPVEGRADIRFERADGSVAFEANDQPTLAPIGDGPDEVCFTPAPGNPSARLLLSDLLVTRP